MKKLKNRSSKKKIKLILIISFILLIIIIFSLLCYFFVYKKGINYKTKLIIEAGDNIPSINDYVSDNDLEKVSNDIEWLDLESADNKIYKTGEYTGKIGYKDDKLNIILIVKDTKAPVIDGVKDFEMLAYEKEPDLLEGITVSDNSNEDIKIEVLGEYDSEEVGVYEMLYYSNDSNGNEVKVPFKITVKENKNVTISKSNKGYKIKNYYGITYIEDVVIANKTYSLPSNFSPNNLVSINGYIRVVDYVKDAFNSLQSDATSIGLNIYASSGYRSYKDQDYIYNNYVRLDGKEIADTYSARAGHSEHQTGLAIDLNSIDMSFDNTDESNWLKDNCYKYGFIIRYPKGKDDITGYMYEPWHIRYVGKNLAIKLYNNGDWITLEEYFGIDSKYK